MKVRAQIGMVLNLDKCIGCHTCSVTCKNVWTSREGVEYAWFNNVETKPGIGYPKDWENQKRWNGGWRRTKSGALQPKQGGKWRILANIFANPDLPEIVDFYRMSGEIDYLLKVRTRDIAAYRRVLGERISALPHVAQTSTFVAMETVKDK